MSGCLIACVTLSFSLYYGLNRNINPLYCTAYWSRDGYLTFFPVSFLFYLVSGRISNSISGLPDIYVLILNSESGRISKSVHQSRLSSQFYHVNSCLGFNFLFYSNNFLWWVSFFELNQMWDEKSEGLTYTFNNSYFLTVFLLFSHKVTKMERGKN